MKVWHLYCRQCERTDRVTLDDMLARLRELGMLRREAEPEPALIEALATEAVAQMACRHCGEARLGFTEDPFGDEAWPEAKACVACGKIIPPERVELFPSVERCASCQSAADQGNPVGSDREFCSRCGDVMKMRVRHGHVASYELICSNCGARS